MARVHDANTAAAFERLFAEHESELYGYLVRRLDSATAERAVADVFAAAWWGFCHRDPVPCPRTWLYGLAIERVRAHRRIEIAQLALLARRRARSPGVPAVARALADLDPLDRDMLTLHVWAGVEHESVAELVGLPVAAARRRIARAHAAVERAARAG
jgi:RNA polymerase sigma-70 factor (ECF subfamily)